jgi:hypothetical protein
MDRFGGRPAKPNDRRLIVDGASRPRAVRNLGQAVIKAGLLPVCNGPILTLDAGRNEPGELMRPVRGGQTTKGLDVACPSAKANPARLEGNTGLPASDDEDRQVAGGRLALVRGTPSPLEAAGG